MAAFRSRRDAAPFQNISTRLVRALIAEIGERAGDPIVTPACVLLGLFVRSIIRENRSVLDLLAADYTYLNEKLARLYGILGVMGPGFRRVPLNAAPERGGLLGQGSILLLTSHTTKTSPILRGKWILDSLLNSPPPPPPGVPALEESAGKGEKLTARQQIERHRKWWCGTRMRQRLPVRAPKE